MATTKNKITLSTDSMADLGDIFKKLDITPCPSTIAIGDKEYTDLVDITPDIVYNAVEKQKIMPKTGACPEAFYDEVFAAAKGQPHIHIGISDHLSASYENAVRAAKKYPNVHVINSKALSTGIGLLVVQAYDLINEGKSAAEIVKILTARVKKTQTSFVLDTLKYMHKGGRCSGFALLGANLLKIHPSLYMTPEGQLVKGKIFKGSNYQKVVDQYVQYILESYPKANKELPCFVTHTADMDPVIEKRVVDAVKAAGFKRVYNTTAGCVITCHCGRNCIGVLFTDGE